jgi:hypothetical protein
MGGVLEISFFRVKQYVQKDGSHHIDMVVEVLVYTVDVRSFIYTCLLKQQRVKELCFIIIILPLELPTAKQSPLNL